MFGDCYSALTLVSWVGVCYWEQLEKGEGLADLSCEWVERVGQDDSWEPRLHMTLAWAEDR